MPAFKSPLAAVISTVLLGVAGSASAAGDMPNFSYTSLALGPVITSYSADANIPDLMGVATEGRLQFARNWYLEGDLMRADGNDASLETELLEATTVVGFASPIVGDADFFAEGGANFIDAEFCNANACLDESEAGLAAELGVRSWISDAFELSGSIAYRGAGDADTSFKIEAAGWLDIHSSLYVGMEIEQDYQAVNAGFRYTF